MQSRVQVSVPAQGAGWPDFSLALGGPLHQLLWRCRLSDAALRRVPRRIAFFGMITWAPLLALSALQGALLQGGSLPFLNDIGVHLRFLVVVPLLIAAEPVVHLRLRPLVDQFHARGLVRPEEAERFDDALREAMRWRNSVLAEVIMIVLVYVVGFLVVLRRYAALDSDGWYAAGVGDRLSPAGYWLVFVSLPVFQFLLLRWYFRLLIWARFLWRISRLDLDLDATDPDRAGGLGFLGSSLNVFALIATAHGVLLTGMIANRIFYAGARLPHFQLEVLGAVVILFAVFAGPLMVFAPLLARVKRAGLTAYGALAKDYVRGFRRKWLCGRTPSDEPLLGSADIQSLADLSNSFAVAERMRLVPVSRTAALQFVAAIVLPILPLVLTIMPADKLIGGLIGVVL